jgi:hypothetical protein
VHDDTDAGGGGGGDATADHDTQRKHRQHTPIERESTRDLHRLAGE